MEIEPLLVLLCVSLGVLSLLLLVKGGRGPTRPA